MTYRILTRCYLIALFLCGTASITHAEEQAERPGPWQLGVGAIIQDKPYTGTDTEFKGIPSRPAYFAPSSTTPLVGVTGRYRLSSHWSVFGLLTYERLPGGLLDSPIVDADHSSLLLLTLTRSF